MKSFSIHQIRVGLSVLVVAVLFVATYMSNQSFVKVSKVGAASVENVSGWAYSQGSQGSGSVTHDDSTGPYTSATGRSPGLGWISFNHVTEPSSVAYGVSVAADGAFSGHAYMGNGSGQGDTGWIHFAPAGPYPEAPLHSAKREGNTVAGWARAISTTGGFDGWIKLSGVDQNGGAYGVNINPTTGNFSGKAWGDSVLGWIDFAPMVDGVAVQGVTLSVPLPVCNQTNDTFFWGICPTTASCTGNPSPRSVDVYKIGGCTDGSVASPSIVDGCGSVTTTCTASAGSPVCGDGVCASGETLLNCPRDCKGSVRQF